MKTDANNTRNTVHNINTSNSTFANVDATFRTIYSKRPRILLLTLIWMLPLLHSKLSSHRTSIVNSIIFDNVDIRISVTLYTSSVIITSFNIRVSNKIRIRFRMKVLHLILVLVLL